MRTNFRDIDSGKTIDLGAFLTSGADVSPMDIPLKGDMIKDDFNRYWEVVGRQHYWTGPTHTMTLYLSEVKKSQ